MSALLVVTGIGLLVLPGTLAHRWNLLSPREWTRLNVASLAIGLWAVRFGLLLGAAPTILRALGVEHAAVVCNERFGPVLPGGAPIGWASAMSLAFIQHRLAWSRRRTRRLLDRVRVEPWVGQRSSVDGVDLVRLPTSEPLAYAVDGSPPQVVIGEGLLQVLSTAEFDAVVRHELSHLAHDHQSLLSLAAATEASVGWCRPVRRSTDALRLGVERWADEDAASVPRARSSVRSALLKVTATMLGPVASFTAGRMILERLAALDREPPSPTMAIRAAAAAPLLVLTATLGVTLIAWRTFSHHGLLGLLGFCPL